MALQIRRGTDAQRQLLTGASAPKAGELIFTTDTKKLFVGDGSTAGGIQVDTTLSAQYLSVPSNITPDATNTRDLGTTTAAWRTGYFNGIVATGEIEAASFTGNITSNNSTVVVNANAGTVTANLTGAVVGNVTGNTAGTHTGPVTGDVKGSLFGSDSSLRVDGDSDYMTNGVIAFDGSVVQLQSGDKVTFGTTTSANGVGLRINSTDHANNMAITVYSDSSNNSTLNSFEAFASRGTIVTPTVINPDDGIFGHNFYGYDGSAYKLSSFIHASVDPNATVASGAVPGQLLFATTPDNGSTLKYMTINKDGNLGINVSNPTKKLEVNGNGQFASEVLLGRMDQTAINALTAANGMIVYNTTTNKFQGYEGGAWSNLI
mgnify:FL=1